MELNALMVHFYSLTTNQLSLTLQQQKHKNKPKSIYHLTPHHRTAK